MTGDDDDPILQLKLSVASGTTRSHAVRIPPKSDLVPALLQAAKIAMEHSAGDDKSAFVMTAVGSLSSVTLRMAASDNDNNKDDSQSNKRQKTTPTSTSTNDAAKSSLAEQTSLEIQTFDQHFEIVSLVGTFSSDGGKHLHMSVSDAKGHVIGGHLVAGTIFTTLELVLGTIEGVSFAREMDSHTGYNELLVQQKTST